jgi:hypothetical protein
VGSSAALLRCLRPASLPDSSSQRSWRASASDSLEFTLRIADGQKRHPRLQREGLGCPDRGLFTPQSLHTAFDADGAEALREILHQDPRYFGKEDTFWSHYRVGRGGQLRGGSNRQEGQWRDHPSNTSSAGGALGTSQALDREPRSGVCSKKGARERLIRLAENRPEWVLGFKDESWFSRLERPSLHSSWTDAGQPTHLIEKEVRKDDPQPKALSRRLWPATGCMCPSWKRRG